MELEHPSFMTCILRVDTNAESWQKTITKVLNNVHDVKNFRMNKDGTVEISGTVFPNEFMIMLKRASKKAQLCHFQFGECSSNLFLPPQTIAVPLINNKYGGPNNIFYSLITSQGQKEAAGYYGGKDGRFLHYGDQSSLSKNSNDSSKEKTHNDHDHDHDQGHNHGHNQSQGHGHGHGHRHGQGLIQGHGHGHGNDQGHGYGHNQGHGHSHDHNHDKDHKNHDKLLHGAGYHGGNGKQVDWHRNEKILEHSVGCINAAAPRPKVQIDCEKHGKQDKLMKRPESQGVNSCCLM